MHVTKKQHVFFFSFSFNFLGMICYVKKDKMTIPEPPLPPILFPEEGVLNDLQAPPPPPPVFAPAFPPAGVSAVPPVPLEFPRPPEG